jgi:hypothetical protein
VRLTGRAVPYHPTGMFIGNLLASESLVRQHAPLCGLPILGFDCYRAADVLDARATQGVSFFLILDRNVLSRFLALREPPKGERTDQERLAAAVMAFCIAAGVLFDATVALGETTATNGAQRGRDEALALAALQKLAARAFAEIASGSRTTLDPAEVAAGLTPAIVADASELPVERTWAEFRPEYGAALKLATLAIRIPAETPLQRCPVVFRVDHDPPSRRGEVHVRPHAGEHLKTLGRAVRVRPVDLAGRDLELLLLAAQEVEYELPEQPGHRAVLAEKVPEPVAAGRLLHRRRLID